MRIKQWCQDWYDATFYTRPEAGCPKPVNRTPGKASPSILTTHSIRALRSRPFPVAVNRLQ